MRYEIKGKAVLPFSVRIEASDTSEIPQRVAQAMARSTQGVPQEVEINTIRALRPYFKRSARRGVLPVVKVETTKE